MTHLIGVKGASHGPIVNRILICTNDACPGIILKADGTRELVKMGQIHYSSAPAPCCTYCGSQFAIASMHARQDAHQNKRDKHRLMDKAQETVFKHAEENNLRLVEGGREGDVGKTAIAPQTQQYMAQMSSLAKQRGFTTGFNSTAGLKDIGKGYAMETAQQGAVLPMNALSASLGRSNGFWKSRNNPKIKVG